MSTSTTKKMALEQNVFFRSHSGNKLAGIMRDTGSQEAVILCHGLLNTKNDFHLPAIAEALSQQGISSLRMDFNGNGDSEGPFKFANHKEEADDIDSAVKYLASLGKQPLGVLGHSKAGSSILVYSSIYGQIPKVCNISGRFNHKRGLAERFGADLFDRLANGGGIDLKWSTPQGRKIKWRLEEEALEERLSMDMAKTCSEIPENVDVLTVHGSKDATIPIEDAHSYADCLRGGRLVVIDGADHNYSGAEHGRRLVEVAVAFFRGQQA